MDDVSLAELRTLRARAYGPDADIVGDPIALARLRELEEPRAIETRSAAAQMTPVVDETPDPPVRAEVPAGPPVRDYDPDRPRPGNGDPAAAAAQSRRRLPWRLVAAWIASVALAAIVGAGIGLTTSRSEPTATGAHYYATLREDPDFAPPSWLTGGRDDLRGFGDYHGLTPVATTTDWSSAPTDRCFLLLATADLDGDGTYSSLPNPSCTADPFLPAVSLTVVRSSPDPLRRTFADGTSLEFVLDGDQVRVFLADPPPDEDGAAFSVPCDDCRGED